MGKSKSKQESPKGKTKARPADAPMAVRLIDHPRARHHVSGARAWGGLLGLVLAGFAAHGAGLEPFDVGVRALLGGIVGMLLAWALALVVWRQLAVAELRAAATRVEHEATALAEAIGESAQRAET